MVPWNCLATSVDIIHLTWFFMMNVSIWACAQVEGSKIIPVSILTFTFLLQTICCGCPLTMLSMWLRDKPYEEVWIWYPYGSIIALLLIVPTLVRELWLIRST